MTHLPYVVACYAMALALVVGLAAGARMRLRGARRRLAAIDPRAGSSTEETA